MPILVVVKNHIRCAMQVTAENLLKAESWCNGSIRGTRLPVDQQEIEISEDRARVGDWIVEVAPRRFSVISDIDFDSLYIRASNTKN